MASSWCTWPLIGWEDFKAIPGVEQSTRAILVSKKSSAYYVSMKHELKLKSISTLSDNELLRRLSELLHQSRHVESELVAHIGEVEVRRLYAREASSSMFRSNFTLEP